MLFARYAVIFKVPLIFLFVFFRVLSRATPLRLHFLPKSLITPSCWRRVEKWRTDHIKEAIRSIAALEAEKGIDGIVAQWHCEVMSMAELMRRVAELPAEQQNQLAAFLLHLRLQHDAEWRTEMARRIDDHHPEHWISLEEWRKELAGNG